jgi:hypothetical protein
MTIRVKSTYADTLASFGDLALYLPLGATNGLVDTSGNTRNGTAAYGLIVGAHTPGPLANEDDGATNFDGTNDAVTTTYDPFTNATTRTFIGWAYRDTSSGNDTLVGSSGNGAMIRLASGGNNLSFFPDPGAAAVTWTGAWTGDAVWVHWATVFNETTNAASLYIDGALVSTQTTAVQWKAASGNIWLGLRGAGGDPYDGKMAGFAVFEDGLTANEIGIAHDVGLGELVVSERKVKTPDGIVVG